jgi:hypothetical protein
MLLPLTLLEHKYQKERDFGSLTFFAFLGSKRLFGMK